MMSHDARFPEETVCHLPPLVPSRSAGRSASTRLRQAGFENVETSIEPAPTNFNNSEEFSEFIRNIVFHRHLEAIPNATLRDEFIADLTRQANKDDPPFTLDYWRLNLAGSVPV